MSAFRISVVVLAVSLVSLVWIKHFYRIEFGYGIQPPGAIPIFKQKKLAFRDDLVAMKVWDSMDSKRKSLVAMSDEDFRAWQEAHHHDTKGISFTAGSGGRREGR